MLRARETGNQMRFRLVVNDQAGEGIGWFGSSTCKWSNIKQIRFDTMKIFSNQNDYTLKFQIGSLYSGVPVYVKSINIILTVARTHTSVVQVEAHMRID